MKKDQAMMIYLKYGRQLSRSLIALILGYLTFTIAGFINIYTAYILGFSSNIVTFIVVPLSLIGGTLSGIVAGFIARKGGAFHGLALGLIVSIIVFMRAGALAPNWWSVITLFVTFIIGGWLGTRIISRGENKSSSVDLKLRDS